MEVVGVGVGAVCGLGAHLANTDNIDVVVVLGLVSIWSEDVVGQGNQEKLVEVVFRAD